MRSKAQRNQSVRCHDSSRGPETRLPALSRKGKLLWDRETLLLEDDAADACP